MQKDRACAFAPSPTLPRKRGRERTEFASLIEDVDGGDGTSPRYGLNSAREMTAVAPAVIPLVHAPDDPGPNGEAEVEPAPEPATPPPDGWSRIRALFWP